MQKFILTEDIFQELASVEGKEWLVTNGIGGYACGTVAGLLTRKYHGILIASLNPPAQRTLLVTKLDETVEYKGEKFPLFANRWNGGEVTPQGYKNTFEFKLEGTTPVWTYKVGDALIQKRIWMKEGENTTYVNYYVVKSEEPLTISVEGYVNYRDHHKLTTNQLDLQLELLERGCCIKPPNEAEAFYLFSRGSNIELNNDWYYNYKLSIEEARNYDSVENHLRAVTISKELSEGQFLTIVASTNPEPCLEGIVTYKDRVSKEVDLLEKSWTTASENTPTWLRQLRLASEQFMVEQKLDVDFSRKTIMAGYPWFTDWSRDAMIALPGLTADNPELAKEILSTHIKYFNRGLLPTAFPEDGESEPQYNNVDAGLWFFLALKDYVDRTGDKDLVRDMFIDLVEIINCYLEGTLHNIKVDPQDCLLEAAADGLALTWMDAVHGGQVFTARAGKTVEVNALWYNVLMCMIQWSSILNLEAKKDYYSELAVRVGRSFQRFWNEELKCLYDVIDCKGGGVDRHIRPNQIFALSLPFSPIHEYQQRAVLKVCQEQLLTPYGLRSLSPSDPAYKGHYLQSSAHERDAAYHQGTVWLWLLPHYAIAHYRVNNNKEAALQLFENVPEVLANYGLGNLGEIFDGDEPHSPQGCIAQAWSVGEILRAYRLIDGA